MALNTVAVVGRIGDRLELRYTPNGKAVLNFNLAVDRPKRQGANQETDWISCVAWEKLAEIINEYCDKVGKQIAVSGRLQSRTYEKDGRKVKITEILVSEMQMLGSKSSDKSDSKPKSSNAFEWASDGYGTDVGLEDIPF